MSRPLPSSPQVAEKMKRQRRSGTAPEMKVREAARAIGLHYRLRNRDLPGNPDLANRRDRWAIFVHGCFWHHHGGCRRATIPRANAEFWREKFEQNRRRDESAILSLSQRGFRVVVIWECEIGEETLPALIAERLATFRQ